jgi:hypothetical protein
MVVAIFCGHPDNLEDSDESEWRTVARPAYRTASGSDRIIFHLSFGIFHLSFIN